MNRASVIVSAIALVLCSLSSSSARAQLPPNQGVLELSTAWKYWSGQKLSAAGTALNISAQFVNDTGNNSSGATMHDIDDAERQRLIKYWGTWRPAPPKGRVRGNGPNAQTLSYTDKDGNYYNVDGSVSGGLGVIHFLYTPKGAKKKFIWHFRVI